MADRTCHRCGKVFDLPCRLRSHEKRKTSCAPILDTPEDNIDQKKRCRFCGRVFAHNASMRWHVQNNCKIAPNQRNGDAGMNLLREHTRRQQAENEALRAQVAALTQNMEQMQLASAQTAIAGDNAVVDGRVVSNVSIHAFGKETTAHVTTEKIKRVLEESMQLPELPQAAMQAVLKAALLIYSDPDYPENLTCYLSNKREGSALVHGQGAGKCAPCGSSRRRWRRKAWTSSSTSSRSRTRKSSNP